MNRRTEGDVESLIRGSVFRNPAHKRALRERLPERAVPLTLDDLDKVVGGAALPEQENWMKWPERGNEQY